MKVFAFPEKPRRTAEKHSRRGGHKHKVCVSRPRGGKSPGKHAKTTVFNPTPGTPAPRGCKPRRTASPINKLCSPRPRTGSPLCSREKSRERCLGLFTLQTQTPTPGGVGHRNYFWEGPESDRKGHVWVLWGPKVTFSVTFGSLPKGRPAWQAAPYRAAKPSFFEYSNLVGDMRDPNKALCSNIKGTRASPAQQGPPGTREK